MVVAPSLYRVIRLRSATTITEEAPALIIGISAAPAEGLMPLADAESEAQTVASDFRSAHLLQGSNATLSAIRLQIRGAVVFHFAGHAIASPQRSGLVLSEVEPQTQRSRLVTAETLNASDASDLQLAVLSACHTDVDNRIGNSGTESLVESFLRAGVPHVVASRWNVDSRETAEFMKRFYASLLAGDNAANAMKEARLALASQPVSTHPYYWSAFELQGVK